MTDRADSEVLRDIVVGREHGLREAMAVHGPAVLGMARRVARDVAVAEEVAQDTFLSLWENWDRVDLSKGSLRSYLVGIARHKAIDRVRSNEARKRATERRYEDLGPPSPDGYEAALDRAELTGALARLTLVQREALVLAYFGGRSYREVAEELCIPEGTAKTRLRDGLRALRRALVEGVAPA